MVEEEEGGREEGRGMMEEGGIEGLTSYVLFSSWSDGI